MGMSLAKAIFLGRMGQRVKLPQVTPPSLVVVPEPVHVLYLPPEEKSIAILRKRPMMKSIARIVADYCSFPLEDFYSDKKHKIVFQTRDIAIFIMHSFKYSNCAIGRHFDQNHSTIIYALRRIRERMKHDEAFCRDIREVQERSNRLASSSEPNHSVHGATIPVSLPSAG
jgi:hypothetical protein